MRPTGIRCTTKTQRTRIILLDGLTRSVTPKAAAGGECSMHMKFIAMRFRQELFMAGKGAKTCSLVGRKIISAAGKALFLMSLVHTKDSFALVQKFRPKNICNPFKDNAEPIHAQVPGAEVAIAVSSLDEIATRVNSPTLLGQKRSQNRSEVVPLFRRQSHHVQPGISLDMDTHCKPKGHVEASNLGVRRRTHELTFNWERRVCQDPPSEGFVSSNTKMIQHRLAIRGDGSTPCEDRQNDGTNQNATKFLGDGSPIPKTSSVVHTCGQQLDKQLWHVDYQYNAGPPKH